MNHKLRYKQRNSLLLAMQVVLLSLLCSCDRGLKLTNDVALRVLTEEYKDFCNAPHKFMVNSRTDYNFYEVEALYADLEAMGLVTVKTKNYPKEYVGAEISPTQTAIKEYNYNTLHTSVAVAKLVPKEILGVSINEEAKTAEIVFIGEYEETPFVKLSARKDLCKPGQRFEKKATLIYYDSGWRLKENGTPVLPL